MNEYEELVLMTFSPLTIPDLQLVPRMRCPHPLMNAPAARETPCATMMLAGRMERSPTEHALPLT
jgi:hypothetical protein